MDNLPEEEIRQICEWLLTPGLSYAKVRKLCDKELGVSPSDSQLSRFYQRYVAAEVLRRRRQAVSTAEEIAQEMATNPGEWDSATIDLVKQKAFEVASSPMAASKDVKALLSLVLKAHDQELKREQVEVAKRKLALLEKREADAKDTLSDGSLSLKQREAKMKQIFGIGG